MKNFLENKQTFMAQVEIDYSYFLMNQINKELNKPIAPINKMIQDATGYTEDKDKKSIKLLQELCQIVIKNKKILKADCSGDEEMLNKLTELV